MAADEVANEVGRVVVGAPKNGASEVGWPEQFRLDELIRKGLAARNDLRNVIGDSKARYYGVTVTEKPPGRSTMARDLARSISETGSVNPYPKCRLRTGGRQQTWERRKYDEPNVQGARQARAFA